MYPASSTRQAKPPPAHHRRFPLPPRQRVIEHVALCVPAVYQLLNSHDLALSTRIHLALSIALATVFLLFPPRRKPPRHTRSCTPDPLGFSPGLLLPALLASSLPEEHHAFLTFASAAALLAVLPKPLEKVALYAGTPLALALLRTPAALVPAFAKFLVYALPHVFTPAEAALSAAPALAALAAAVSLIDSGLRASGDDGYIAAATALARAAAVLVCAVAHPLAAAGRCKAAGFAVLAIGAGAYTAAASVLPQAPVHWLLRLCLSRTPSAPAWAASLIAQSGVPRLALLAHWALCVIAAVTLSTPRAGSHTSLLATLPRAVARKFFHVVAAAIFVPGLLYDASLTSLAASGATLALCVAEAARAGAFGDSARDAVSGVAHGLVDERDGGAVATTHIYLVAACAAPAWVWGDSSHLRLAGVAAVCVLDSCAAVWGTRFGRTKWAGEGAEGRSVEGSLAAWLATAVALRIWQAAPSWRVAIAAAGVAAGVEAGTAQIDNLVVAWALCVTLHAFG